MLHQHTPAGLARQLLAAPWLTGAAIWSIAAASGALNAWGWSVTASGLVAGLLITLSIAAEVLGVRLAFAVDRAAREPGLRFFLALPLFLGVVGFNAWSGHRALVAVDAAHRAPLEAASAQEAEARAELARIEREIAAAPRVPENVPAVRVRAYAAAREAELARLEIARTAARARLAGPVGPAPDPIDPAALWAIVALVEGLKAFGLFAVSGRAGVTSPKPTAKYNQNYTHTPAPLDRNAGRELARLRWARAQMA